MSDRSWCEEFTDECWPQWLGAFLDRLRPLANRAKASPFCWMGSKSEPRCLRHAGRRPYVDDTSNEDGQRFCEKCGRILDHLFTDYGAEHEIRASADPEMAGRPVTPEEAFTLLNVIDCGTPRLTERWPNFDHRSDLRPLVWFIAQRMEEHNV